ncbi:hypothetical protein SDC9_103733 [bioreactor metagenome]|uniref:Uncharacterized protein n=1 Tax=bioreactor metagenome TaxID=1076179 RepID=A0A645AVU4_9ZZZZ
MGDAPLPQYLLYLRPAGGEKRPHKAAPPGRNAGKPPKAGTPDQMEQHSLQIVVGVVGGGDTGRAQTPGAFLKKGIAHGAGGLLDSLVSRFGLGGHISFSKHAGNADAFTPIGYKSGVSLCLLTPKMVVIVSGNKLERPGFSKLQKKCQKTHRIRAPRESA